LYGDALWDIFIISSNPLCSLMEKEIVEDEIDLRDYLRVVWKNRRLILGIFFVALISSGIYSFFVLQDEYQTEAKLSYISNQKIPLADAVEILQSQPIIQKTAAQYGEASKNEALSTLSSLKVENIKNTNQILLKLNGNKPEMMEKYFGQYINVSVDELNRKSIEKLSIEKSQSDYPRLENLSIFYAKQREEINAELEKKLAEEADLEIQRLRNLSLIAARYGYKDKQLELEYKIVDLMSIKEGGRLRSNFTQQLLQSNSELTLLYARLNSIDAKLTDVQAKMIELEYPDSGINPSLNVSTNSNVVELLTPPTDPMVTGPKRTLNVAIAAVLGLFIGVFAAFFKNYLEESASR
ncbi:MAG: Wzz/FepE/Etk N-terminal domain-containing protein, partial [Candidatus Methanoperedens sp.]|nr:Wzz/FepE/Etk N-terminal domain-containing protein [Candidatus Methanoperedens sp.]